ncbi:MAG: hypothetical protein M1820_007603 [Bogoriella megaspora]|nr:MAG: hypothetical protein M1820_007603 [Bogoriella megaspora]
MSSSESESATLSKKAPPSDAKLETALRDAVKASLAAGEEIRVKQIRASVEKQLELAEEFFKTHDHWKNKSSEVIRDEFEKNDNDDNKKEKDRSPSPQQETGDQKQGVKRASPSEAEAPRKRAKISKEPKQEAPKPTKASKAPTNNAESKGVKRASPEESTQQRKRRKPSPASEVESELSPPPESKEDTQGDKSSSELSDPPSDEESYVKEVPKVKVSKKETAKKTGAKKGLKTKAPKKTKTKKKSEEDDAKNLEPDSDKEKPNGLNNPPTEPIPKEDIADDSSELSSLIDEAPAPKKRGRKKDASATKPTKASKEKKSAKSAKSATAASSDIPPAEAEIKRLQSWLVKCGIRKLWHRELAPYDSTSAKIAHLKGMLKDIGMDGRFSIDKARAIKERRELEMDLEAVQEGEKRWGNRRTKRGTAIQSSNEDTDRDGDKGEQGEEEPPKRRIAKGLEGLDFLNDDDGAETD